MTIQDNLVVPVFKIRSREDKEKSQKEGRPIFKDEEVVEVRYAGNRQTVSVFPAHEFSRWVVDESGNQVKQSYAERWSSQYRRFKEKSQQVKEGTPIDELPYLTQAKRSELRALNIYTAEQLAALDGQELKNLGQGGRELKNQAQAYLDNASGSAQATRLAAENVALKRQLSEMKNEGKQTKRSAAADDDEDDDDDEEAEIGGTPIEDCSVAQLKSYIKRETGEPVKGNPNRETLIERATEIAAKAENAK